MSRSRSRVLDPLERFSEIVFGLIMVLSFTCAISVAQAGREEVRTMLIGAIACNLAWGIIDAAFYLIACLAERGRHALLLRDVQRAAEPEQARRIIAGALYPKIAEALQPGDFNRDSQVTAADIPAMLAALTDLNQYKTTNSLSDADLLAIGDLNNSGTLTNADIQPRLDLVATQGGGSMAAVPEPATLLLLFLAAVGLGFGRGRGA